MKKLSLLISAAALAVLPLRAQDSFDARQIAVSFGVISDVHIDAPDNGTSQKFIKALKQLGSKAEEGDRDGIDAVLMAGDLINNAYSNEKYYVQTDYFKACYESVFKPTGTPLIYTPGNHDTYKWWTAATVDQAKNISRRLGPDYFLTDTDETAREKLECRHCVVGCYHILCIVPIGASPVVYSQEAVEWLDRQLAEITAAEPDRYVLILTHPMIYNTVYGSLLGNYWATSALTSVLEKYPQAVTFGGHLHFPLNDPRSVWQGDFTAFGCGSVRYMAIEDGGYENMSGKTVMKDNGEFSQGLLVQFDVNGNLRATRMDFYNGGTIGEPWTIPAPRKDKSHLKKYSAALRSAANKAPSLSGIDVSVDVLTAGGLPVSVTFPKGTDDEFVHHYVLDVTSADSLVCRKKILADFYRTGDPSKMKASWTQALGKFKPGSYKVSLKAYDSWGAESNTVSAAFEYPSSGISVSAPVEHGWLFYGSKPVVLNLVASGAKGLKSTLNLVLIRDIGLMDEVKDTVLTRKATIRTAGKESAVKINLGKLEPGFYQVNLEMDGIIIKRFNIGVNPEMIVSPQDKEPDFDEFWDRTLAELAGVPIDATFKIDKAHSDSLRTTYLVEMKSFGGVTMGGILCKPNKPGKYITYIDYLGYGAQPIWYEPSANPETVEFLVSVRDQGTLKRQGHYRWIDRGLKSKETFYYRGAFCDVVRAIDFVCSLDCVDHEHLYARGESQGGAFTFISASLDHRFKAIAPAIPFLSDYRDYSRIVRWPMWEVFDQAASEGIDREDLFRMLSYFDVKNFTDRIQCPVYMSFGLQDVTCPPHTNFAGFNMVRTQKEYYCGPTSGHELWADKAWHKARAEWFKKIIGK